MCGGFIMHSFVKDIENRFQLKHYTGMFIEKRYNARPTQKLPVVLNEHPDKLEMHTWGILPPWSKSQRIINTRKDSLDTKPFFKKSFHERRCIIPANGFYEWKPVSGHKVPFRFGLKDDSLFAFAGIWMQDKDKEPCFTIITVEPNELVAEVHNRMPAILPLKEEREWLNPDLAESQALAMLMPFPKSKMAVFEASSRANTPKFDDPELLNPDPERGKLL
jgi:putative SOS response-associated peptidase YedK